MLNSKRTLSSKNYKIKTNTHTYTHTQFLSTLVSTKMWVNSVAEVRLRQKRKG